MATHDEFDDITEARAASAGCEFCGAEGLATIFHADYNGSCPYVTEPDHRGYPRRRLTRTVAYCVCPAGRFLQFHHQEHSPDVYARIPDLTRIIDSRRSGCLWTTKDPNAIERPDSPTSWRELVSISAQIAAGMITPLKPVEPAPQADRDGARRELGIFDPEPHDPGG